MVIARSSGRDDLIMNSLELTFFSCAFFRTNAKLLQRHKKKDNEERIPTLTRKLKKNVHLKNDGTNKT